MTAEKVGPGAVVVVNWGGEEIEMRVERKNADGSLYMVSDKFDTTLKADRVLRVVGWERA